MLDIYLGFSARVRRTALGGVRYTSRVSESVSTGNGNAQHNKHLIDSSCTFRANLEQIRRWRPADADVMVASAGEGPAQSTPPRTRLARGTEQPALRVYLKRRGGRTALKRQP